METSAIAALIRTVVTGSLSNETSSGATASRWAARGFIAIAAVARTSGSGSEKERSTTSYAEGSPGKLPRYPVALARIKGPPDGSDNIWSSAGIAAGLLFRASVKASARTMSLWRDWSPYHSFTRRDVHSAFWSLWQRLHAFGMLCRMVFSGAG